jgi:thiol-disulfide isomerase/thioredoxin
MRRDGGDSSELACTRTPDWPGRLRPRGPAAGRLAGGIFAAALLIAVRAPVAAQDVGLPIGTVPPAVVLEDLDGNAVDLGGIVGTRPVLIEFWATWCPVCAALEPRLQEVRSRFGDRIEILVVAVGVNQNPRTIRRHLTRHQVSGRVLYDACGAAARAFRAPTTSYIVVLDAAGRTVYTGAGDDQDLLAAVARALP